MTHDFLTAENAKKHILSGECDDILTACYGVSGEQLAPYRSRISSAVDRFTALYGNLPLRIFSVSGRTELGGNHTDHQKGCVLAGGISLDMIAVAAKTNEPVIRITSEGYPEETISVNDLSVQTDEQGSSRSLIRGIAAGFSERGAPVGGFCAFIISDVLKGSGLSSSAAYEITLGAICNDFFADSLFSPVDLAIIAQYAENVYFGKPCGLMDQMACALGGAVLIDFADPASPEWKQVPLDLSKEGYALCIIDSGADHADLTAEYAAVPAEMKMVANALGKTVLRETDETAFWERIPFIRKKCGDRAVMRAIHFYQENARAEKLAAALAAHNFQEYLRLVTESGRSSVSALQNIYASGSKSEQSVAIALAMCEKLLNGRGAYRVHGGGFAGTVQAYVPIEQCSAFRTQIDHTLGEGSCHVLQIRTCGATALWE